MAELKLPASDRGVVLAGAGAAVAMLLVLLGTLHDVGMTSDEPTHLQLEYRQRAWWRQLVEAESWSDRARLFSATVLRDHFDLARQSPSGDFESDLDHPILGRHLANLALLVTRKLSSYLVHAGAMTTDPWLGARVASVLLFSVLGATVYMAVASRYGALAGATATAALVVMPRVFGHAHLDALDFQVAAWWFFSFCVFFRALRSWRATAAFALLVGLAWGTQFSGLLVLVPLSGWSILYRRRDAVLPLVIALLSAPVVLVLISPHWWHDPLGGLADFVWRSTHRHGYMAHHCYYLGRRYAFGLPWHNGLLLACATVPIGVLALGLLGMVRGARSLGEALRRWFIPGRDGHGSRAGQDAFAGALTLVVAFWLALRALPASPDHDGVRLYLHAFVFFAPLIGVGAAQLQGAAAAAASHARGGEPLGMPRRALPARLTVGAALLCALWETCWIHPHYLSYYSRLVGHPVGAAALGLESTYWADAITPEVVEWLNDRSPTTVYAPWTPTLDTLKTLGHLDEDVGVVGRDATRPEWILLLSRQSNLDDQMRNGRYAQWERRLLAEGRPVATWSTRDGVPLVRVYAARNTRSRETQGSLEGLRPDSTNREGNR